jgi:hypothetical protein
MIDFVAGRVVRRPRRSRFSKIGAMRLWGGRVRHESDTMTPPNSYRVRGWATPVSYRFLRCSGIMHHYFGVPASWRPPDGERASDRDAQHGVFSA